MTRSVCLAAGIAAARQRLCGEGVRVFRNATPLTMAALVGWLLTAALGVNLLLRGKAYRLFIYALSDRCPAGQRPPVIRATLMGLHILCAVCGLVLWTSYALFDRQVFAYASLALLAMVAVLGISVVDRWRAGHGRHARQEGERRGFPVWSATGHVMIATTTLVLVVLVTITHLGE